MRALLSPEQIDRYRHDGFLVLEGLIPAERCDALRARAAELVAAFDPNETREQRSIFTTNEQTRTTDAYFLGSGDKVRFFFEEEAIAPDGRLLRDKEVAINKIGHAMHDLDPVFDAFSRAAEVRALVGELGVDDPRLVQSMYIFKQPFIGGEVRCHQDATFLHTEPESTIGLWFALEDATRDNGCLWAIPGGHRAGLRRKFVRSGDATSFVELDRRPFDEGARVPLEVEKGAVIVLDGLVPHLSETNRSPRSRHAYTLHVISGASLWPSSNWLQRATPARGFGGA